MKLLAALATDDGKTFINRHFGDAEKYYIYEINDENYKFIKSVDNTSVEEKQHADPKKARSIIEILKLENVQVVSNLAFGPNINRVKRKLVPVITAKKTLKAGLEELISNHNILIKLWNKGEKRDYLVLK